jgi:hypothetical protein
MAVATGSAIVLAIGCVVVSTAPASATAWNCTTGYSSVGAWGKCTSGDTYHVKVLCQNIFTRASETVNGNTVTVSSHQVSTIQGCPSIFEQYYGQPWV